MLVRVRAHPTSCSCRGEIACLFRDRILIELEELVWTSGCPECSMEERFRLVSKVK